ncbi:MAG: DUF309 domain-containing protein [Ktedonobacterales bacterium]
MTNTTGMTEATSHAARCALSPPAALLLGIEQFNRREYFECHETLEALWNVERAEARQAGATATYHNGRVSYIGYCDDLYKGILQVGVGCYHLLRGNYRGAVLKLRAGADYLEPFAPRCQGVEVAQLIADARRLHTAITTLGPDRLAEGDLALLPIVRLVVVGA